MIVSERRQQYLRAVVLRAKCREERAELCGVVNRSNSLGFILNCLSSDVISAVAAEGEYERLVEVINAQSEYEKLVKVINDRISCLDRRIDCLDDYIVARSPGRTSGVNVD